MAKAIEDRGHLAAATKPLQLRRYEAGRLPDPGQCVDCLIIVNDRADGVPRARLAISNGASWDFYARVDEIGGGRAIAISPPQDLMPLVREAVNTALPALMPQPVKVVEHIRQAALPDLDQSGQLREDIRSLAVANLELSEHLTKVLRDNADLMARVEFIERHALAKAELEAG